MAISWTPDWDWFELVCEMAYCDLVSGWCVWDEAMPNDHKVFWCHSKVKAVFCGAGISADNEHMEKLACNGTHFSWIIRAGSRAPSNSFSGVSAKRIRRFLQTTHYPPLTSHYFDPFQISHLNICHTNILYVYKLNINRNNQTLNCWYNYPCRVIIPPKHC